MYERLGADVGPLSQGSDVEAADQPRTSGPQASHDPGVTAAGRVRLVADGGGLENRYGARVSSWVRIPHPPLSQSERGLTSSYA